METTFHNVTITIEAENPKAAYAKLCEVFAPLTAKEELEYTTDTYTTNTVEETLLDNDRETAELFPDQEEG